MTWMERIIALLIIVVLLIFAVAQQVELAKVKAIVVQIQTAQQVPPVVVSAPVPIPIPTIDQQTVNKPVTHKITHRRVIHKHHRRQVVRIPISDWNTIKTVLKSQDEVIQAQHTLLQFQKELNDSNQRLADLKLQSAELKNTALQLELKAVKAKCNYETIHFTKNQFSTNTNHGPHINYNSSQYTTP